MSTWSVQNYNYYYVRSTVTVTLVGSDGSTLDSRTISGIAGQGFSFNFPNVYGRFMFPSPSSLSGTFTGYNQNFVIRYSTTKTDYYRYGRAVFNDPTGLYGNELTAYNNFWGTVYGWEGVAYQPTINVMGPYLPNDTRNPHYLEWYAEEQKKKAKEKLKNSAEANQNKANNQQFGGDAAYNKKYYEQMAQKLEDMRHGKDSSSYDYEKEYADQVRENNQQFGGDFTYTQENINREYENLQTWLVSPYKDRDSAIGVGILSLVGGFYLYLSGAGGLILGGLAAVGRKVIGSVGTFINTFGSTIIPSTVNANGTISGIIINSEAVAKAIVTAVTGIVAIGGALAAMSGGSSGKQFKTPKKGSGKEKADDVPSWARGNRPYKGESGNEFAKRLLDEKYGKGNYPTKGSGTEYSKLRKWGDRGFE